MNITALIHEILGGRNTNNWDENAEETVVTNIEGNQFSLSFRQVWDNLLNNAPVGSKLQWMDNHRGYKETQKVRRALKYRYDRFYSNRELLIYLQNENLLAGKHGSPNYRQIEQLLGKFEIWYTGHSYSENEKKLLNNFLGLEEQEDEE